MKKILAAVICIIIATTATMAKNNHQEAPAVKPEVHQQHKMHDPVVNMDIIKELGLSNRKIQQIEALQQRKQKELASIRPMKQHRPNVHQKGQRPQTGVAQPKKPGMDPKQKEKMMAFKDGYRKELRSIMGTEKYLTYVEHQNDRLAARHHRHGKKGQNNARPQVKTEPHAQSGRRGA